MASTILHDLASVAKLMLSLISNACLSLRLDL
jgi:hypothetical protein